MSGLPQSTEVRRALPKAQIYKKFELRQSQRDAFDRDIARLEIVNIVAPQTLPAIAEGEEVKAIFVVEVALKRMEYDPKNIVLISHLIPQRIVFILRYEGKMQLAVYHAKLFTSGWSEEIEIPVSGLNLDVVWQNIVTSIGEFAVAEGSNLKEQIEEDDRKARLLQQISALEKQMRTAAQPRRQRELYAQIKKLKKNL